MLIRHAQLWTGAAVLPHADVRIDDGRIGAIGALPPCPGEAVIEARGGLLLPGLHDHHIHLAALAARRSSVACGPPEVTDADSLARALQVPGRGWLRGTGFHESVLGNALPDAAALDRMVPDRPLRMQHGSGRMWLLNTRGLEELLALAPPPPGLERIADRFTGRLFEEDAWLQRTLGGLPPDLADVSADLARRGVTGITDMSPRNDPVMARHLARQRADGRLRQSAMLAGGLALADAEPDGWSLGPVKLHLHEAVLPDFDATLALVARTRRQGRALAVHCVSEVELVFTLALLETAGAARGDRIEHASVAAPDVVARMQALGLAACVQPHFIAERGDRYLADVEPRHHADLYRLRSLRDAGLPLAGGSDAPYGRPDPWASMAAAVSRRTPSGAVIGAHEALTPEQALALYLADPADVSRQRLIAVGAPADLCLLHRPWAEVRDHLAQGAVRATIIAGELIHQSVDQPPLVRPGGTDPAA